MTVASTRGVFVFLLGLIGYVTSFAFFLAALGKLALPDKFGFWVGPHGIAWGTVTNTAGEQELAGRSFIWVSLIVAFLVGSATTLFLRWLLRPSGFVANLLYRLR